MFDSICSAMGEQISGDISYATQEIATDILCRLVIRAEKNKQLRRYEAILSALPRSVRYNTLEISKYNYFFILNFIHLTPANNNDFCPMHYFSPISRDLRNPDIGPLTILQENMRPLLMEVNADNVNIESLRFLDLSTDDVIGVGNNSGPGWIDICSNGVSFYFDSKQSLANVEYCHFQRLHFVTDSSIFQFILSTVPPLFSDVLSAIPMEKPSFSLVFGGDDHNPKKELDHAIRAIKKNLGSHCEAKVIATQASSSSSSSQRKFSQVS